MKYIKSTSFTMIDDNGEEVQLIKDNLYDILYRFGKETLNIKGRAIDIDDGEGQFSTYDKPSVTLDCSSEFTSKKIDILLDRITYISKYE